MKNNKFIKGVFWGTVIATPFWITIIYLITKV